MKKALTYATSVTLAAFGLLTLFLSGSVILDLFGIRAREGNFVLFIVWANFICSLIYLFSVYGFVKMKKWTFRLLRLTVIILIIAFFGLQFHISSGGIYETKTIGALIFRIVVSSIFTVLAWFLILKPSKP